MNFTLGPFGFYDLRRPDNPAAPPELPREHVEVISRPGINGTGLLLLGNRGRPFPMNGLAGAASREIGLQLIELYHAYIGADPLVLVWADENFDTLHDVRYQILDVTETSVQRVLVASNGIPYIVRATLTLLPVANG